MDGTRPSLRRPPDPPANAIEVWIAARAKEALALVEHLLADQLGLALSPEKTKISRFHEGFTFLGFDIKSRFVRMRAKSEENFKTKVREITRRSHNLDVDMITRLNRVIRGTANYFAMPWSYCGDAFRRLDRWIRMRLRCMKFKRKSQVDNVRVRLKHFRHEYHDAMIDHDKNVGAILDLIDELGIADNTIVLYSTDNGPHTAIRGPMPVRRPSVVRRIPIGKVHTVSHRLRGGRARSRRAASPTRSCRDLDWVPTLVAAAGDANVKEKLLKGL